MIRMFFIPLTRTYKELDPGQTLQILVYDNATICTINMHRTIGEKSRSVKQKMSEANAES